MLSRIAESLFWIGRYIERAEDTARILDVHIHHLLEAPTADEALACQGLLNAMGAIAPPDRPLNAHLVTDVLAFDEANPSSIVASLTAARTNARGVSEAISSEMWESLNATYNALPGQVGLGRRVGPYGFFRYVRERAAILAGLTDSTMSRDDAWRFLVLGRSMERVDMLARLLSTGATGSEDTDEVDWVILLRSCSAHEAFLRTYSREPEPVPAAEFLLLDRLFPRSIFCALSTAEQCLAELDPRPQGAKLDESRRVLGLVRTNLEFRRIEELLGDLPDQLRAVQAGCSAATAALASRYFRQSDAIEWTSEADGLSLVALEGAAEDEAAVEDRDDAALDDEPPPAEAGSAPGGASTSSAPGGASTSSAPEGASTSSASAGSASSTASEGDLEASRP